MWWYVFSHGSIGPSTTWAANIVGMGMGHLLRSPSKIPLLSSSKWMYWWTLYLHRLDFIRGHYISKPNNALRKIPENSQHLYCLIPPKWVQNGWHLMNHLFIHKVNPISMLTVAPLRWASLDLGTTLMASPSGKVLVERTHHCRARPWKSKKNLKRLVPWNTKSLLKVMVMVFPKSSAMKISWPKNGKKHAAAACINFLHRIFPCWDINVANLMQKLTIILGVSLIKLHKITTKKPIWVWFYA